MLAACAFPDPAFSLLMANPMTLSTYLAPCARAQLDLPNNARIDAVLRDRVFLHARVLSILARIDELIHLPGRDPAAGMVIAGPVGSGKTVFIRQLTERYRAVSTEEGGALPSAVVSVNMSGIRDVSALYRRLLRQLLGEGEGDGAPKDPEEALTEALRQHGVRVLVVDEAHDVLVHPRKTRMSLLSALISLMQKQRLPVILLTIPAGLSAVQEYAALHERMTYETLPIWRPDAYLADLLTEVERTLPLRLASGLARPAVMEAIVDASGGALDVLIDLIRRATAMAIVSGAEQITIPLLEQASNDRRGGRWPEAVLAYRSSEPSFAGTAH